MSIDAQDEAQRLYDELDPYSRWCVRSNLQHIKDGTPASEIVRILRHNGYPTTARIVALATGLEEA